MFYSFTLDKIPTLQSFYTVSRSTEWQIADDYNIIIFVTDGCCEITFGGKHYVVEKGDVFFIPAKEFYIRKPIGNILCTMHYIHFRIESELSSHNISDLHKSITDIKDDLDSRLLSGESVDYPDRVYLRNLFKNIGCDKIESMLDEISLFSDNRQLMSSLQSRLKVCNILAELSEITIDSILTDSSLNSETVIPDNLKKAIGYIIHHSYEQITLDDLASYCNVSKQQLIRYFKSAFGTTPINYITEYKLYRAKEYLFYQPSLSIKEIAEELGFHNQYYFTRVFSKHTGETPSAYRYRTVNYAKLNPDSK